MNYLFAILPIIILLCLMIFLRWGGQKAGPVSWVIGVIIAFLAFGITPKVLWVSQVKGLLLTLYVMAIMIPALYLYQVMEKNGGIEAVVNWLENTISERGFLLVILAWAFSGMVEGLVGFGIPIAIVAPMLVALGVEPILAVSAVAVGHAWGVTFGNMGVVLQTLSSVVGLEPALLIPAAAITLGVACVACGISAALILKQKNYIFRIVLISLVMAGVQAGVALAGLYPLSGFLAGVIGVALGIASNRKKRVRISSPQMTITLIGFGILVFSIMVTTLIKPVNTFLATIIWKPMFPEVVTRLGFTTMAGSGQIYKPFLHPGFFAIIASLVTSVLFVRNNAQANDSLKSAFYATIKAIIPTGIGVLTTIGLSALMDHAGMTMLLAQGLSRLMGKGFPVVSALIGILGAFATGSNNNSNVLFAPLQKNVALILGLAPALLLAAQTAGGALGSMISPAKLMIGCSTVGIKNKEGEILRQTLFYCLGIGILIGLIIFGGTSLSWK